MLFDAMTKPLKNVNKIGINFFLNAPSIKKNVKKIPDLILKLDYLLGTFPLKFLRTCMIQDQIPRNNQSLDLSLIQRN